MRVLYLITCLGHGRGGHFHTLRTVAEEMSEICNVSIISIGPSQSSVLKRLPFYRAYTTKFPAPAPLLKILKFIRANRVSVIHSFDAPSYLFARIVSLIAGVPVLHTKCGGPCPKYYPKVRNLVVFSTEDMRYFRQSAKHEKSNVYHIPNRVFTVDSDNAAIEKTRKLFRTEAKVLLRVARFCEHHKKSITGSIELVKRLRMDKVNVQLMIVGAIEDKKVYQEIKSMLTGDIILVTNSAITNEASRIIEIADMVIGTGRGAMEAAIQGKILLGPVKNMQIPVLVDQNNIDRFLACNFSDRTEIISNEERIEYQKIKNVLLDREDAHNLQSFMLRYACRNFLFSMVREDYLHLYSNCDICDLEPIDLLIHFFLTMKIYIRNLRACASREAETRYRRNAAPGQLPENILFQRDFCRRR